MIETFYAHIEFAGKTPWSINLPFLCTKCGVCCTLEDFLCAGKITAEPDERPEVHAKLKVLFDELGKIWENDEEKYDQHIQTTPCPFVVNKACSIYEIRPVGCRLFPKTAFGMESTNCEALTRFKKQRSALVKGRRYIESYYRTANLGQTVAEAIKPVRFSEKQYQNCLTKLQAAKITNDELELFDYLNGQSNRR